SSLEGPQSRVPVEARKESLPFFEAREDHGHHRTERADGTEGDAKGAHVACRSLHGLADLASRELHFPRRQDGYMGSDARKVGIVMTANPIGYPGDLLRYRHH